jgi:phenylalanyl-tRNA synthetase beta chain
LPVGRPVEIRRDPVYLLQLQIRGALVTAGASEAVTYVTVSEEMLAPFTEAEQRQVGFIRTAPLEDLLRLKNPLQADRNLLRTTLIPSLLEPLVENLKHEQGVRLFEVAKSFVPTGRDSLPKEVNLAGIAVAGKRTATGLFQDSGALDFFDLKGIVLAALASAGVANPVIAKTAHPALHPGRSAVALAGETVVAVFGELRPDVARGYGLGDAERVGVAELDLDAILAVKPERPTEVKVPRFLPAEQDFAVVVREDVPAGDVRDALAAGSGPLATGITLFDIYRGPQIGEGKKSMAFRVTFTAPDRALTDAELTKVRQRIEKVLKQRVSGALRG